MKPRQKRIALIAGGLASIALAAVLTLNALDSNIALYVTPTEVLAGKAPKVSLNSTNQAALEIVSLDQLKQHAVDLH